MDLAESELVSALHAFIQKDANNAQDFPLKAGSLLKRLARRASPTLPDDLLDDVVQETYLLLLPGFDAFDQSRGSIASYLYGIVRNAAHRVTAAQRPPATRVRSTASERNAATADFQKAVDEESIQPKFDERILAMELLAAAPLAVSVSLRRLHLFGISLRETAASLKISRFQIHRQTHKFQLECRRAA